MAAYPTWADCEKATDGTSAAAKAVFEFTPSQSVAPPAWITANPGYWKPKASAPKKP